MQAHRTAQVATFIVLATGVLWGFYWLPVRALALQGLTGAWGTLAITGGAIFVLTPLAAWQWRSLIRADRWALAALALGGAAFALYSIGFVYGRVAMIILLFFLTPVWSTLIARYMLGWDTPPLRIGAIAVGLAGLAVMLSAQGNWPVPRTLGEWMALASGVLWAVGSTGVKIRPETPPVLAAFVFACGAAAMSFVLAPMLEPVPQTRTGGMIAMALGAGALWWGLSMGGLMWAASRLEPARVGILLMAEVLVGALSAAVIAGEHLGTAELIGGALVLGAGLLEVWPDSKMRPGTKTTE